MGTFQDLCRDADCKDADIGNPNKDVEYDVPVVLLLILYSAYGQLRFSLYSEAVSTKDSVLVVILLLVIILCSLMCPMPYA